MPPAVSARLSRRRGARFGHRELGPGIERADDGRSARRVVVVQLAVGAVVDVAGGALFLEVVERSQQEVTLGLERLPIEPAHGFSPRRRRVVPSFAMALAVDHVFVFGGGREPGRRAPAPDREHDPGSAEHERDDRDPPRDDADAAVRRRQQDVLAVDRDVRVADLRVGLTGADALHDVGADRARFRRVAVGDRLADAHRARELVVEPRRARRGRVARARARREHDPGDHHDGREREPRHPPPSRGSAPQPQVPRLERPAAMPRARPR